MIRRLSLLSITVLASAWLYACGSGATGTGGTGGSTGTSTGDTTSGTGGTGDGGRGTGDGGSDHEHYGCPLNEFAKDKQVNVGLGTDTIELLDDATWTKDKIYVVQGNLTVYRKLTIEAGTVVCFAYYDPNAQAGALTLDAKNENEPGGSLIVEGNGAEHVTFTAFGSSSDYWLGVSAATYAEVSLHYVDFYNASHGAGAGYGAFTTVFKDTPAVTLDHTAFHSLAAGGALRIKHRAGFTPGSSIEVTSYDSAGVPQFPVVEIDPLAAGTLSEDMLDIHPTYIPDEFRVVRINENEVNQSVTWKKLGVPYVTKTADFSIRVAGVNDPAPVLTLDPGVLWETDASILVGGPTGDPGDLVALGSAADPVRITSLGDWSDPAANWGTLAFVGFGFDAAVSRLDHVKLTHGGNPLLDNAGTVNCHDVAEPSTNKPALVVITGVGNYNGPLITNSVFSYSGSDGIRARCAGNDCIDSNDDYTDPADGNSFDNIAGVNQFSPTSCL